MKGIVKNINKDKYYFFTTGDDGKDYFCHNSALVNREDWRLIRKGVEVEFEPTEGDKGSRAESITLSSS